MKKSYKLIKSYPSLQVDEFAFIKRMSVPAFKIRPWQGRT